MKKGNVLYKILNPYRDIVERIVPGVVPLEVYLWHVGRYIFALKFIGSDSLVLDVACGVGYGSYILARKKGKKVIGVDISKDAIDYAKARYSNRSNNIEFLVGDAVNMPINSSKIDVIISFETIEHVKNTDAFLMECNRVLKDYGTLVLSTPNKYISLKKHIENPYHVNELFIEEIIDKLNSLEFKIMGVYGQRPVSVPLDNVNIKNTNKYITTVISKLMPQFIKKKIHSYYYLPKKTSISRKIIKIYENNSKKFEEWIVHNGVGRLYLPLPISDIESDKYRFDVFVVVAKKV